MVDKIIYLETEKEKYPLLFSFNVMETIQEVYGSYNKWVDLISNKKEANLKALKFGLTEAMNEGIEVENEANGTSKPAVTQKQVGRILTEIGLAEATNKLKQSVVHSADSGENEKN